MTGGSQPTGMAVAPEPRWLLDAAAFARLVGLLVSEFDEVIAPVEESGVIRLRPVAGADELAAGVVDDQEAGTYRLDRVDWSSHFTFGPGPDSLKAIVHPPRAPVWTMRRSDGELICESATAEAPTRAVIGVRACDLRALDTLTRTQVEGPSPDAGVAARRDGLFLVAVDCSRPAPTCFCESVGSGPQADAGFDLALTELRAGQAEAEYVARVGSERGADLLARLVVPEASDRDRRRADRAFDRSRIGLLRELPTDARSIVDDPEHPRWQEVADRCLTCGNCTAVCPTCFCTDMDDEVALDGDTATRHRVWDTCFSEHYSCLGGRPHRASPRSRYRQWLTHKVATWLDQFGESGCVGCGRCITWCPVGIDITAEVEALLRPAEVPA